MSVQYPTLNEVQDCIKYLGEDYTGNYKINMHYNVVDFIISYSLKSAKRRTLDRDYIKLVKDVLKKRLYGCYNSFHNEIEIFTFNHTLDDVYKQKVIFTVFHEVRHYYQLTHMNEFGLKSLEVPYKNDDDYINSPIEKDADEFAKEMMNKHCEEISNVLNIDSDWEVAIK